MMTTMFAAYLLILPLLNQPRPTWTAAELAMADTGKGVKNISDEERKVILLVNLARLDGKKYLQTYFREYSDVEYEAMSSSNNKYFVSLKSDLDKIKGLPMLVPDNGLINSARYHARDSEKHGLVGHTSADGTAFGDRLPKYIKNWNRIAENCSYGYDTAPMIVGQLLLDEDVPSLGHRKSIIDGRLQFIGVAIATHPQYKYNCVMDFCAKFD